MVSSCSSTSASEANPSSAIKREKVGGGGGGNYVGGRPRSAHISPQRLTAAKARASPMSTAAAGAGSLSAKIRSGSVSPTNTNWQVLLH